jgi:hypothetical protein
MLVRLAALMIVLLLAPMSLAQSDWRQEIAELREALGEQQKLIKKQSDQLETQQILIDKLDESGAKRGILDYSGGFVLSSPKDEKTGDSNFRMRIGSWGQFRHNFLDSKGPNPGQNDLDIERLRLVFDGHAFKPSFQYFLQLDADSDAGNVVDMLDYYVTYDLGKDLFCWHENRFRLRLGQWKIGFNRAREESGTRMQFSDRSTASVLFDFDRSIGVGVLGELGRLDWQLTLANGIDTGGFRSTRAGLDQNFAIASRINWLATGDWGKDGHADLDWRTRPAVRLGTGYTFSRRDTEGAIEFASPRVVDSGELLARLIPDAVTSYDQIMYSTDFNLKYRGCSIVLEYYFRQFTRFSGATVPNLFDHGYWAEAGYFLIPERLQLLARHSYIVGDSGTLGDTNQSSDEVAGGLVWYLRRHNFKLTFDATRINGAPVNDTALSIRPGDRGMLYRTQFQWKF